MRRRRLRDHVSTIKSFYGYLQVVAVEKGVDVAIAILSNRDTPEMKEERYEKGAVNSTDILEVGVWALKHFKEKGRMEEDEQFRQVCNVIRDFYGGEDNDGFGQRYTGRDDVPYELGALAFGINFIQTPALLIKAVAETWHKDFWALWKEFCDLIRHTKRTVYDMVEAPETRVKPISTLKFLGEKPDDMVYYWTPGCDIVFSDALEEQFKKWRDRYDDLLKQEIRVENPLKWMLSLLQYADARYYYIFAFTDFIEESAEHLTDQRYLALWKIFQEMLYDPKMEEMVDVLLTPLPAEEEGKVYPMGQVPCRQVSQDSRWKIRENRVRQLLRRYLALVANRELRGRIFGF